MHSRFNNPHLGGGHMHTMTQQQPMQQMQQIPQGVGIIQLPNGMVMLPNGMVVTPHQAQALMGNMNTNMQPSMSMQQMPMGMMPLSMGANMPVNINRFSNQSQTVTGGISGMPTSDSDFTMDSRFQPSNTQMGQTMNEQAQIKELPTFFSISVTKNIMFDDNTKVILNNYFEEIKPSQIHLCENNITLVCCFEEAIERCIETAYEEDPNKLISLGNFLVENSFYKAAEQDQFNKIILDNDIKAMYKAVKTSWPTLNNKYDIFMFDKFDRIITDTINDFIIVNSPIEVYIDSFRSDFNDLLKFLRNLENCDIDLEDELIIYMNKYIENIKSNLELKIEITGADAETGQKVTYIPEQYIIAYVDKYSHELGVTKAPNKLTKIEDNAINVFIQSVAKTIMSRQNIFTFYMVTIDRIVLQFVKALNGDIFIKKI